ncbi:sodium- and chloride-dependent GABA transporter ine isoform X1 [Helicoverpa armigera]|uniref:sodium- and chloride-dependent GABA transporter ine isoform X1 n=1 Tax=Helicoverpa armigera TaxID=29058 RepID=UPI002111889D|nr:sodium- and chloride-dependent GABA transporter ine isoform X1 [Helicoverpa armigera]
MSKIENSTEAAAPSVAIHVEQYDGQDRENSKLLDLHAPAPMITPSGQMRKVKSFSDTHRIRDVTAASGAASARCLRPYEQVATYPEGSDSGTNHYGAPSVRSLASIGMGCTDGRKMVIRRVPTSPTELFHLVRPPTPPDEDTASHESDCEEEEEDTTAHLKPRRPFWANKIQFVLACVGYSVGLGNVWRFPYLCYKSGGGAFLIPYFIILLVCGVPMLFMELAVGQYTAHGPIGALSQICPLFKGAGLASVVISFLMSTYYAVIIAWAIYYFFTSFKTEVPWASCSNRWNTPQCWVPNHNMTKPNGSQTPTEQFFEKKVLSMSAGIEFPNGMRWELAACLVCAWVLVYFALWKSIKSSAKVRYITTTLPFLLIIVFLGRSLTLDGADKGLRFFFKPEWELLKQSRPWVNAASQVFNSIGVAFGSMIMFASYNRFDNNFLHDTVAVSLINAITSLIVGIFTFATIGNIAFEQNTPVKDVIADSPGLLFVVYPQAIAKMPASQLWAVLFFFMFLCLGLNSQFAIVEVVVTSIQDGFPDMIRRRLVYHELLVLCVCGVSLVFGLPHILHSGIYVFQLMDYYAASLSITYLAFFEVVAIAWFYGVGRLSRNIKQMTGRRPSLYFRVCWLIATPALLLALWVASMVDYTPPSYRQYQYPTWAQALGWIIASLSLLCIPVYAVFVVIGSPGNNWREKLRHSIRPTSLCECGVTGCDICYSESEQPDDKPAIN